MEENQHTQAHNKLESIFKNKMAPAKKSKPKFKLNKKTAIIISSIIGAITVLVFIFALLVSFGIISTNMFSDEEPINSNFATSSMSSSEVVSQSSSSESSSSIEGNRLNFPRFFTSQESASEESSQESASTQTDIVLSDYEITLLPQNIEELEFNRTDYEECSTSTPVIGGNHIYSDQEGFTFEIGHQEIPVTDLGKRVLQLNKNFIQGNAFLMADGSSQWGPDFLNYFKLSCSNTNIEKLINVDQRINSQISFFDSFYSQIEILYNSDFINYGYSVYGLEDGYIIKISRIYTYDQGFTRAEKEECQQTGTPDKNCLIDVVLENKKTQIESNLLDDLNRYRF